MLQRRVLSEGPEDAAICIVTDVPTYADQVAGRYLSDFIGRLLFDQFRKFGIMRSQVRIEGITGEVPPNGKLYLWDHATRIAWQQDALERLSKLRPNVFVPLGEEALSLVTELRGIDKWHLSIVPTRWGSKAVPLLAPWRVNRVYKELPFLTFGAQRVSEQARFPALPRTDRTFIIQPSLGEIEAFAHSCADAEWLSIDIETGRGQITCVGISDSPKRAISIPTLPHDWASPTEFYRVWEIIRALCESGSRKVFQNGIYDTSYFSRYGIRVLNFTHDTMVAQKFLHPELPMGLDYVARIYTEEPYWKDDAKDWSTRQDIRRLYSYNCKDAAVTLEAAFAQRLDLQQRNLLSVFDNFIMRLTAPVAEMSWRGLCVDREARDKLAVATQQEIERLTNELNEATREFVPEPINPRSPNQVKTLLKRAGYRLPLKQGRESSDREALLKLRRRDPGSRILTPLIRLSAENKKLSSYLTYDYDSDSRMRYTLSLHGTETGRMSCYQDPWGRGINAQTIPAKLKGMYRAPPGTVLIEVDLCQAESRFVAWDGPVPRLQQMYLDGVDIHKYVASHPLLFNKPVDQITKPERQLGKKTGHAANYGMQAQTLSDSCLKEMDLDLPVAKAQRMLEGYHDAFEGGVLRWQARIRDEIMRERKLTTPFGRERAFYERPGDDLWREAYAYRPQSSVTDAINHLALRMYGHVPLLLQIHDALLLECPEQRVMEIITRIKDQSAWNPIMRLPGGELRIPIEIKCGKVWNAMEEVYVG